jgi:hypothetical protein
MEMAMIRSTFVKEKMKVARKRAQQKKKRVAEVDANGILMRDLKAMALWTGIAILAITVFVLAGQFL